MQVNNIIIQLRNRMSATTDSLEVLTLTKVIQALQLGNVNTALYFSSLPDVTLNTGLLYFVEVDEMLYWSDGYNWNPISRTSENKIWAWGENHAGALGNLSVADRCSPISIADKSVNWIAVAAGTGHAAGLKDNGSIWTWGDDNCGALGNNTLGNTSSPVTIVGGFTDWCEINAGSFSISAVRKNGTAWAWGLNTTGKLGDGTIVNRSSPVAVLGGFTDWCFTKIGLEHSTGVRSNGTAWAWGRNTAGTLGDNTTVNKCSPIAVTGGFTDWCDIDIGICHTIGLRKNGTIWAWGCNSSGQLGDGTTVNKCSPVSIAGGVSDWYQIAAGGSKNLAIRSNGTMWSWGAGSNGQLGSGATTARSSPGSVVGGFTDWCKISAGSSSGAGIRTNGSLWAWGYNGAVSSLGKGILGDGTTVPKSSPVSVIGNLSGWTDVSFTKVADTLDPMFSLAILQTSF